jgi:hypothetical protein
VVSDISTRSISAEERFDEIAAMPRFAPDTLKLDARLRNGCICKDVTLMV